MTDELKILIVDDDDVDRMAVRRALKSAMPDAVVEEVASATATIEALRTNGFDCVLLDYMLPDGDGLLVLRNLNEAGIRTPVVMLTGQGNERLIVDLLHAGAADYLNKQDLNADNLFHCIQTATRLCRADEERRQAQETLAQTSTRLQYLIDNTPAIIYSAVPSGDFKLTFVSENVTRVLGYEPAEILADADFWFEHIHPEDRTEIFQRLPELFAEGQQTHEYRFQRKDGSYCWIQDMLRVIQGANDDPVEVLGSLMDITERKKMEAQREQMQRTQKMEVLGQLTAGIAHDFNNILASIIGYTDLALDNCAGSGQQKLEGYLDQVYHAGERARDLIQQMLTFGRSGSSQNEALDPLPLVKETVKLLHSTLPSSITVKLDFPREALPSIGIEPVHLQQIVMNLCVNARDAMHGKGQLRVALGCVDDVQCECDSCHQNVRGKYVELSVQDTGEGIDPHILQNLFEPFFSTKDVGVGTGLGLSVVHGIVHDYGGHIRVESTPGEGTTFRLWFPIAENVTQTDDLAGKRQGQSSQIHRANGQRILVVDDEVSILGFMQEWLSAHGYVVNGFTDSHESLEYFRQNQQDIDLVITDQTMPGLIGMELAKELLALSPELPIILCSGNSKDVNETLAHAAGIRHFVPKPFEREKLLMLIHDLFANDLMLTELKLNLRVN